jgi:hypothetical protein
MAHQEAQEKRERRREDRNETQAGRAPSLQKPKVNQKRHHASRDGEVNDAAPSRSRRRKSVTVAHNKTRHSEEDAADEHRRRIERSRMQRATMLLGGQ